MINRTTAYCLLLSAVLMLTCCTSQKSMSYVRDIDSSTAATLNRAFQATIDATLIAGDAVTITVNALDMEAVRPFNMPSVVFGGLGTEKMTTQYSLQPYRLDSNGDINFPILGKLHLAGLTLTQAKQLIAEKLAAYISDPIVNMQLLTFKVTVTGEVAHPGQFTVTNERATIFDALAMAGDMTIYGKRQNVLVAREVDGKLQFGRLNLNSSDVFLSPYYYLQQNDVVYVEPNQVRAISSQNIPLYLSAVSTLASMATVIVAVVNLNNKSNSNTSASSK